MNYKEGSSKITLTKLFGNAYVSTNNYNVWFNVPQGKEMNIYTAIGLGITIAGFIGGIITSVAKLAVKTGQIMEKLQTNEKRDDEERAKSSAKFSELYNRMGANESSVNALQTNVNNLTATCNRIESKLDRIIEREAK